MCYGKTIAQIMNMKYQVMINAMSRGWQVQRFKP